MRFFLHSLELDWIIYESLVFRASSAIHSALPSSPRNSKPVSRQFGNTPLHPPVNTPANAPVQTNTSVNTTVNAPVRNSVGILTQNLQHLSVSQPSLTYAAHQQYNVSDGGVKAVSKNTTHRGHVLNRELLPAAGQSVGQPSLTVEQPVKRSASFNVPAVMTRNQTNHLLTGKTTSYSGMSSKGPLMQSDFKRAMSSRDLCLHVGSIHIE